MPSSQTLRRLHSLTGLVALGAFLLLHLGVTGAAMRGQGAYISASAFGSSPLVAALEIVFVALPFAFHAVYGLWIWRRPRPDLDRFPPETAWIHGAERASGLVLAVFVLAHVWELRAKRVLYGLAYRALYSTMVAHLSSTLHGIPLVAIAYLLGVTVAVFHLSAGLWMYLAGHTPLRGASLTRTGWACAAFGLLLFVVGASTVVSLATGMHFGNAESGGESICAPITK